MPTIAQLSQLHPSRDPEREADLYALYQGDQALEARLSRFLIQREREPPTNYQTRKKEFHYRNYLGAIIDYFAAMLFTSKPSCAPLAETGSKPPEPDEFYALFREDCDRAGGDLDAFFKDRITDAIVYRRAWFSVEQPSDNGEPAADLATFQARKLGECWLRKFDTEAVLDWEHDDSGNLAWVLTHRTERRRAGLSGSRNRVVEIWEEYLPDRVNTYSIAYDEDKKPDPTKTEVPLTGTRLHKFGRVPALCIELPLGLWAASRLKTPQLAHFRSINMQSWSMANTCYAMPVAKVKDPTEFKKTVHGAGYGIVIQPEEDWSWEAPPGAHFAANDTEIKAHKDEIFRIAHQMALGVENNATAIGRTAESKSQDAQSTRVILTAYGRVVKEAIELVYDMVSTARGENLKWAVGGLDDFAGVDTGGFVTMCGDIEKAGGVPSKSFNADLKYKLATSVLPDADETQKRKYRDEIDANTPDPAEEQAAEREAALKLFGGAGGNQRPGEPAAKPTGKAPFAEA